MKKRCFALICFIAVFIALPVQAKEDGIDVKNAISQTITYEQSLFPNPQPSCGHTAGAEWALLGIARSGEEISQDYYQTYLTNLSVTLEKNRGDLQSVTNDDKVILALTAIGLDPTNFAGYNLIALGFESFDAIEALTPSGPAYALLALNSNDYQLPPQADYDESDLVGLLLQSEIKPSADNGNQQGGWAWTGDKPDPDLTAMVLQALAPYDTDAHPAVVDAVARGLSVLSGMQLADGGFSSYGVENACSVAQVVTALCELGIDPTSQVYGFNQGGANMVENLLSFALPSGGFIYQQGERAASAFSSEQSLYALVDYQRLKEGKSSLYRMDDVTPFFYHVPDVAPEQSGSGAMTSEPVQTAILDNGEQTQSFQTVGVQSPATGDDGYGAIGLLGVLALTVAVLLKRSGNHAS